MNPKTTIRRFARAVALLTLLAIAHHASAEAPTYSWSGTSTGGQKVSVPSGSGATVLAFVRPDQAQSRSAIDKIRGAVDVAQNVSVIVVISGERAVRAAQEAQALPGADASWPVVFDADFAVSGTFDVHVWPTTVVVKSDGAGAAHLAGMPASFATDLQDYLAFASGAIDQATLKQRLAEHEVVGNGNAAKADRQLALATQLVESGRAEEAAARLVEVLDERPGDPRSTLLLARVHLLQKRPADALALVEQLPGGAAPGFQLNVVRARALIELKRWDEARRLIPETLKLNPNPAESHYLMGLVAQHDGKWQEAADAFRRAYELSAERSPARPGPSTTDAGK